MNSNTKEPEKEFIPYEQALELKELGFNKECLGYYHTTLSSSDVDLIIGKTPDRFYHLIRIPEHFDTLAPLYQQAFRWFREKYDLRISNYRCSIKKEDGIVIGDGFRIFKYGKDTISTIEKETYEEAELDCIDKLIEIAKQQDHD